MGLKIKVFRNEHEGRDGTWYTYSTPAASKNDAGDWKTEWIDVVFVKAVKGTILENRTRIDCTDCFLGSRSYISKGGEEVIIPQIVVMDFEELGEQTTEPAGYTALTDDDVPF